MLKGKETKLRTWEGCEGRGEEFIEMEETKFTWKGGGRDLLKERKLNLIRLEGRGEEYIEMEETKYRTWKGGQDLLKERKLNLRLGRGPRGGGIY